MTATTSLRVGTVAVIAMGVWALVGPMSATAQDEPPLEVSVRSAEVGTDGTTSVLVDVRGAETTDLDANAFGVTEDGESVGPLDVRLSHEAQEPDPRTVVVALDTSGSTAGEPIELAKEAIAAFTTAVTQRGVAVGLVTFADQAQVVVSPTTDGAAVLNAVGEAQAAGGTALHDAIVLSATQLQALEGQRSVVVFSDGADSASDNDLPTAVEAVTAVGARVSSVALQTVSFDPLPLEVLADATSGSLVEVDTAEQLVAAFELVAEDIANQYLVTYPNTGRTGQFEIQVTVTADTATAADTSAVLSTVTNSATFPPASTVTVGATGSLQQPWAAWLGVGILAIGLVVLLTSLLVPSSDPAVLQNLRASLGDDHPGDDGTSADLTLATAALSRHAIHLVERVPKPDGYDLRVQQRLDRAGWPLRTAEFTTLRSIAFLVGLGLAWALSGSLLLGLLAAAAGWVVPSILLDNRVNARQKAFMEQLPSTLQLLAGSLKVGHGVLQAIDMVVRESREPTRSEFQRVVTESRLGMPLEDSLTTMADRIGTEDFRWVAVAINIQRRVGGNLATLLETVAGTLRERSTTRRQVSALSAEGRVSAVILTAMPIVLAAYMFVVNPGYLGILFTDPRGQLMLVGAVVAMVVGIVWMRQLIQIDV